MKSRILPPAPGVLTLDDRRPTTSDRPLKSDEHMYGGPSVAA
jgi:hypothetical protein